MNYSRPTYGFTLVEMLVALSVLGVTMTAAVAALSTGLRVREVARLRLVHEYDAERLLAHLRDDLDHVVAAEPAPMITEDSLVLWRTATGTSGASDTAGLTRVVTYQWSGSSTQDSVIVRVERPLRVDPNDHESVRAELMRWARARRNSDETIEDLLRDDTGVAFGERATLGERSGSWIGFPHLRDLGFALLDATTTAMDESRRVRLDVRVGARVRDPDGVVAASFWLVDARTAVRTETDLVEVRP